MKNHDGFLYITEPATERGEVFGGALISLGFVGYVERIVLLDVKGVEDFVTVH